MDNSNYLPEEYYPITLNRTLLVILLYGQFNSDSCMSRPTVGELIITHLILRLLLLEAALGLPQRNWRVKNDAGETRAILIRSGVLKKILVHPVMMRALSLTFRLSMG